MTPDYRFFIGSAGFSSDSGETESGSGFRWFTNSVVLTSGAVAEDLLLHFDVSARGVNGETPTKEQHLSYSSGKWGSCLAMPAPGRLQFARENNLRLDQGMIEMWIALRADGTNAIYSSREHLLFQYLSPSNDFLQIAQNASYRELYVLGRVGGQWESISGDLGGIAAWKAGEWHHLAFTYSVGENFMRLYVDGALTAENTEGDYRAPEGGGDFFAVGGGMNSDAAYYLIDELRISGRVADAAEIEARARRTDAPQPNEVWLAASNVVAGSQLIFEFTPASTTQTGAVCQSTPQLYSGIPITNALPPSTLLPAGATSMTLVVETTEDTTCAYSVGQALAYGQMLPFASGAGSLSHRAVVVGLNPDPYIVNDVYVRCATQPDYLFHLRYRSLSQVNPSFPRKGNLWGWPQWIESGLSNLAKVDLWLGATPTPEQAIDLRRLNPHVRILTSINAVENWGLPDDYYLKDINGDPIEVWPGSYRLNLTKPYVADYQARLAYETVLETGLMADGVFFDNFMTDQSWLTNDIYGNPVELDADEDGVADNPAVIDAAWKAGVFREIETFRQLMPNAIVSGHTMEIDEPGISGFFNGISIGFATADIVEEKQAFGNVFDRYNKWLGQARSPTLTMVESSPMDQIAYGYGYSPLDYLPTSTLEFARTYHPYVRFGLAFTLMNDGYFAHELGDTYHGNNWWYDELDFDLGYPLGPAQRVTLPGKGEDSRIINGSFEDSDAEVWQFTVGPDCAAAMSRQTADPPAGAACVLVDVTQTTGTDWHIEFAHTNIALAQGVFYNLSFWARSGAGRFVTVHGQKDGPDWRYYGLHHRFWISPEWRQYTISFQANETVSDMRLQFFLGETNGTVWLDDVRLVARSPDVFRRDFTKGVVLLNATRDFQDVPVGPGFRRLTGTQAPMHEWILDDQGSGFSTVGTWTNAIYDSGCWKASGPYYHSWAGSLHQSTSPQVEARWQLPVERDDTYTISAWWPAAPEATDWSANALYEVVVGGVVVASTNLDQTTNGDQWHELATVPLLAADAAFVRLKAGSGSCVADALYVRSQSRYNNGQLATQIRLQPMDGIILKRDQTLVSRPSFSSISLAENQVVLSLTNLMPGVSYSLQRTRPIWPNTWQTVASFQSSSFATNLVDGLMLDQECPMYRIVVE